MVGAGGAGPAPAHPCGTVSLPLSPAGKSTHVWAHDLPGLFEQRRLQQQVPLSIPTNRLTQRIIPRSGTGERGREAGAGGTARVEEGLAHFCCDLRHVAVPPQASASPSVRAVNSPLPLSPGLLGGRETVDVQVLCCGSCAHEAAGKTGAEH